MSDAKRLIKKYRLDEVRSYSFDMTIGLYVDPATSKFYAKVPEIEGGKEYTAPSLEALKPIVLQACIDYQQLVWTDVIRIHYHSSSYHKKEWNPEDPATASDSVGPLSFERFQVAVRSNGDRVLRVVRQKRLSTWREDPEEEEVWEADEQAVSVERASRYGARPYDGGREIPWDEPTWDALVAFQDQIRLLDHNVRKLVARDDFIAVLLQGPNKQLAIAGPAEVVPPPPPPPRKKA